MVDWKKDSNVFFAILDNWITQEDIIRVLSRLPLGQALKKHFIRENTATRVTALDSRWGMKNSQLVSMANTTVFSYCLHSLFKNERNIEDYSICG